MMQTEFKEYIVGLKENVDYNTFWYEIENEISETEYVPSRPVEIINERPLSTRCCHYALTDSEATALRQDSRIQCVEIPADQRTDIQIKSFASQSGVYYKFPNTGRNPNNALGVNWGLFRLNSNTNNTIGASGNLLYNYPLDGTGVDIVIQDGGLQCDHPEFENYKGETRVQKINWYSASGLPGTQPADNVFYIDTDGHGTHVAGIAAGKTYGRAKNSNIYSITVDGLNGANSQGMPISDVFDVIKGWHNNKPIDSATGFKRPTVVNMSWGYVAAFQNITGGNYQGNAWTGTTKQAAYGMIGSDTNTHGVRVSSVDIDISEMLAAGIIICGAAGNSYQTIDTPTGINFNNYYNSSVYGQVYYMQGGSPTAAPGVISVGNIWTGDPSIGFAEQKAASSESGPRVDIYAPGTFIISTMSTTNAFSCNTQYPNNNSFLIGTLSGTSMAAPQVAGMCAQLLQAYPSYTPAQIKAKIITDSASNVLYDTGLTDDYSVLYTLHGSQNSYAFQPFNTATNFNVAPGVVMNNITINT
jgi:subtilisin family serine protease